MRRAAGKAWYRYRRIVKQEIENRLAASIHSARFIDLEIQNTPSVTHLPWLYKDQASHKEFAGIEEAFAAFGRRMLLLGAPGSGKTTTLLHIAQQLVAETEHDQTAPLPLIVNLSKLKLEPSHRSRSSLWGRKPSKDDQVDNRVKRWLIGELTGYPGVSKDTAQAWLREDRLAFLLDGLDEVDAEYRAELIRVLNTTFLKEYPDAVVVICSRIHEYWALQDGLETRLQLNGGVTLQSLTDAQIGHYLDSTQATGLAAAIPNDEALYEMAKTPLTLSMMVLAYGSATPTDITEHLSLPDRRHHLMEAYVAKKLQRKERRDRRIPFDESYENDVPVRDYAYGPEKVNEYLG